MTNDLYDAIEACKQNMLRSLDVFEQNMNNIYQKAYDNMLGQLTEFPHASLIEPETCKKQDELIGQSLEKSLENLHQLSLLFDNEEEQESPQTDLDDHLPTDTKLSSTVLEQDNEFSEPMMHAGYELALSFSTIKNMDEDLDVCGGLYYEQYAFNSLSPTKFDTTTFATVELATTKFAIIEFVTRRIATSEVAMNKQRISIMLVFDPGGISFIYMVTTTCIAISFGVAYFWDDLTTRTSVLNASAM